MKRENLTSCYIAPALSLAPEFCSSPRVFHPGHQPLGTSAGLSLPYNMAAANKGINAAKHLLR